MRASRRWSESAHSFADTTTEVLLYDGIRYVLLDPTRSTRRTEAVQEGGPADEVR